MLLAALILIGCATEAADPEPDAAPEEPAREPEAAQIERLRCPFTGDLAEIRERRLLRVLISYGKTNFFHDQGQARGFEHELMSGYGEALGASARPIDRVLLIFIPTPFDRLLDDLARGLGDVAAAKYLAFLRDRYFSDPGIEPAVRVDFAWAAYNAGPARIRQLRQKAAERGFDPDRWFSHVEKIAAEEIGRETADYVANVNKYYAAYRLQYDATQRRREQLESSREQVP